MRIYKEQESNLILPEHDDDDDDDDDDISVNTVLILTLPEDQRRFAWYLL